MKDLLGNKLEQDMAREKQHEGDRRARPDGRSGWRRAGRISLLLLPGLWTALASAEVTLATTVKKIVVDPGDSTREEMVDAVSVLPGEMLRYTIAFSNQGTQDVVPGSIVITNPLPVGTEYVEGSASGSDTRISFSTDGENFAPSDDLTVLESGAARRATAADYQSIRWTYQPILRAGESGEVSFDLRIP